MTASTRTRRCRDTRSSAAVGVRSANDASRRGGVEPPELLRPAVATIAASGDDDSAPGDEVIAGTAIDGGVVRPGNMPWVVSSSLAVEAASDTDS